MKFNIRKPSYLNEALLGNRNMGYPTNEIEVKGAVPVDFAAAINEYQTREKKTAETFKEFKDKAEEFVKQNHNRKVKGKATSEMKKMHLSEAVDFGNPMEFGRGPCVPIVHNYTRTIKDAVEGLRDPKTANLAKSALSRYAYQLMDAKMSVDNFNTYWQARYPASMDYIEKQLALIPDDVLKSTGEMKELKLSESLFEDATEEGKFDKYIGQFGSGPCAPISHLRYWKRHLDDAAKHLNDERFGEMAEKEVAEALDNIKANLQEFIDFNTYWTKHYALVRQAFNQVIENADVEMGMPESLVNVDVPITANVTANGNTVPFLNGSAKTEDIDPDFFAIDNEQTLTESPTAVMDPPVKKKRKRGPNEKPDIADYSSMDLWYAVYDELSATTDHEGEGKTVNKQLKARRGERYEHVYPHGDTDIVVYAMDIEDLDFAKRVADHYGVIAEKPKKDNNPRTNGYYKYSMIIRIPPEKLYTY